MSEKEVIHGISYTLVGGQILIGVHSPTKCSGRKCPIHNQSDHHMVTWSQNWNPTKKIIERICMHDIAHPDPDEVTESKDHECCGCCRGK
jgi:hypothetical protein